MGRPKKPVTESKQPVIKHDAFISKNKKRKEKRHLQNLTTKQVETGDFIPVKKNALKPSQLTGLSKKGNAQLSTSLPIKGSVKGKRDNPNRSFAVSAAGAANQPKKVAGILSNPNTPKRIRSKNEHVTFELSANKKKILDKETLEEEKMINEKVKKPFQKSPKKQLPVESSDESDDDDSITGEDFLDMEASEGEETVSEDSGTDLDDSSDDEEDVGNENKYLSNFLNDDDDDDDDESDSEDEDENDDDDDDEEDEDDDDDIETPLKVDTPKLKSGKAKNGPLDPVAVKGKSVELKPSATPTKKGKAAELKNETKLSSLTPTKEEKVTAPKSEPKKTKKEQAKSEDTQANEKVEKKNKKAKVESTESLKKEKFDKPSNFIAFIRKIPSTVTEKGIKSAVSKLVAAGDVLAVMMVKARKTNEQRAFVYLKDSKSLGNLIHKKIDIGDSSFVIYRAKSSAEEESSQKFVAFLPRVPLWVTEVELKQGIEKEIGVGKVTEVVEKKINKIRQTKNILVSFADVDALKKAIQLGDFTVKDQTVIIREAVEGIKVPVYRAVLANIPEKTNEAIVKKTLEGSIGKDTVINVRFSFRKKSFAFVVFNDETAMEKALALGDSLSVKGQKVEVRAYAPHQPRKRAPPSEQSKAKAAEKRKRKSTSKTDEKQEQASPKKLKTEVASSTSNASSSPSPNGPRSPNKKNKRKKSIIASPSGQVKATKNTKPANKQKFSKAASTPSSAKASKVSPLKGKIQSKKANLKGEISKQRKAGKK